MAEEAKYRRRPKGGRSCSCKTANHRWDTVSSKFSRYRDTLLVAVDLGA
jgi:hypothetical protein